jgi:phage tail sheath gpL-like
MGMTESRSIIDSDIEDATVTAEKMDYSADETPVNGVAAQGTITMADVAVADETFVIDTQTFTWKAARSVAGEVTIGANAAAAVTNIVTAITADMTTVTAVDGAGDTVVLTAATKGIAGNAIVFTENSTNMTVNGSGTLGTTTAGVDGTVGTVNQIAQDGSYLYVSIAANTIADDNWRRVSHY